MLPYKILITSPARIPKGHSPKRNTPVLGLKEFKKHGFKLIEFPTIRILQSKNCKALDQALQKINSYDYLVFTSKNSVNFFMQRFFEAGKTKKDMKKIAVCAIGGKTAEEIKRWKIKVDLVPDEFNAEGLVKEITKGVKGSRLGRAAEAAESQVFKGLRFLLPRAEKTREVLPEKIKRLGGRVDSPVLYKTVKPKIDDKQIERILHQRVAITVFTSASAFDNFIKIIGEKAYKFLKNTAIAVIGPVTAKEVRKAGFKVSIMPKTATIKSMTNEITKYFKKNKK